MRSLPHTHTPTHYHLTTLRHLHASRPSRTTPSSVFLFPPYSPFLPARSLAHTHPICISRPPHHQMWGSLSDHFRASALFSPVAGALVPLAVAPMTLRSTLPEEDQRGRAVGPIHNNLTLAVNLPTPISSHPTPRYPRHHTPTHIYRIHTYSHRNPSPPRCSVLSLPRTSTTGAPVSAPAPSPHLFGLGSSPA